jgi:hypothetical protein
MADSGADPWAQYLERETIRMRVRRSVLAAAAALLVFNSALLGAANGASVESAFSSAVARVLDSVRGQQEFLRDLTASEFREFVQCAQGVMASAPLKRKQYVLAASNQGEMRQRFDEVALDNRAALKQRITRECA